MESVTVRMVDRVLGETIWEYAFAEEDMERGVYTLSGYDLYAGEFMQKHWDQLMQGYEPDPVLEVSYTIPTDHGPATSSRVTPTRRPVTTWIRCGLPTVVTLSSHSS